MIGELTAEQVERVLDSELVGRLGCHADGRTYVVPVTSAYRGGSVYGHSALGRKVRMLRENPEVCFEVDHLENLSTWQSVIGWGTYEELHGEDAARAMHLLLDRFAPHATSATSHPRDAQAPPAGHGGGRGEAVVYRIRLREKTGRYEKPGPAPSGTGGA